MGLGSPSRTRLKTQRGGATHRDKDLDRHCSHRKASSAQSSQPCPTFPTAQRHGEAVLPVQPWHARKGQAMGRHRPHDPVGRCGESTMQGEDPTVPIDTADASRAHIAEDRPSTQRQTHLVAACSRRTIAPEVARQEPSQRTVTMTCPSPSTAPLQCDHPGSVFFIDGKRERRILDFHCPACDSYVKTCARRGGVKPAL